MEDHREGPREDPKADHREGPKEGRKEGRSREGMDKRQAEADREDGNDILS